MLYAPDAVGLIEAFDASSGRGVWTEEPTHPTRKQAAGQSTRGVEFWGSRTDERIVMVRGTTFDAIRSDWQDLPGLRRPRARQTNLHSADEAPFFSVTGPIVVNDVVVLGGNGGGKLGGGDRRFRLREGIRARGRQRLRHPDGKLRWTFHVSPRPGEFGDDTWGQALDWSGDMGRGEPSRPTKRSVSSISRLPANGLILRRAPTRAKSVFERLVCLDAKTGKRVALPVGSSRPLGLRQCGSTRPWPTSR